MPKYTFDTEENTIKMAVAAGPDAPSFSTKPVIHEGPLTKENLAETLAFIEQDMEESGNESELESVA